MHQRIFITLLFFTALSLSSCDHIRGFFGYPKAAELEAIKNEEGQKSAYEALYREDEERQRQIDASKYDDDISGDDEMMLSSGHNDSYVSPSSSSSQVASSSSQTSSQATNLYTGNNRYHLVVGSFRDADNAQKMMKRLSDNGHHPSQFYFKSGLLVVSADSFSNKPDADAAKRRMQENPSFYDCWVYDVNQGLHRDSGR